jgi:hypothetical protein
MTAIHTHQTSPEGAAAAAAAATKEQQFLHSHFITTKSLIRYTFFAVL